MTPRSLLPLLASALLLPAAATADAQALLGDASCKPGDPDCNVCARDVEASFAAAAEGKLAWHEGAWHFAWKHEYPPEKLTPQSKFQSTVDKLKEVTNVVVQEDHVQGFVRTNVKEVPFAGSHSTKEGRRGSLFFLRDKDGRLILHALHETAEGTRHPSGVHAIGRYVAVGEGKFLRLFDLTRIDQRQSIRYEIPQNDPERGGIKGGGAGLGLVKLKGGDHLLIASTPGDAESFHGMEFRTMDWCTRKVERGLLSCTNLKPRITRFYRLEGSLEKPKAIHYLGESVYEQPASWKEWYGWSENLSAITECGTGRIYTVHTTGENRLHGKGYWRLSLVSLGAQGPALEPKRAFHSDQDIASCHHRSTATVSVLPDHQLELLCHQRDNRHRILEGNADEFHFKRAQLR